MTYRAPLCWTSAVLLSVLPHLASLQVDVGIDICAHLNTEGGYTGLDVLGLGFGALAALLPLVLVALAVAAWRSPPLPALGADCVRDAVNCRFMIGRSRRCRRVGRHPRAVWAGGRGS
ncbi:hypothetical protein AB0B56_26200 [Streptosporangium canum]|uniref:hypothetical protein n=1 Tax=Streptosporangium canum TaxID=324952 RepID=UPI003445592C